MAIDIVTFVVAVSMLLFVYVPSPASIRASRKRIGNIWKESFYGFRYIYERRSLLGLQLTFFCVNFIASFSNVLLSPMILARSGEETGRLILGSVLAIGGIGGVVGSILMSIWGGPKRKVNGILFGLILLSLLLMGLGQGPLVWAAALFLGLFLIPILNGSSQAIWQRKVPPDVQGRVFATRLLIAQISAPAAMLISGPSADRVFEPSMMPGGNLASVLGWLIGIGPGAGMSLMFVITGIGGSLIGVGAYTIRTVRYAEDLLPDYDAEVLKKDMQNQKEPDA